VRTVGVTGAVVLLVILALAYLAGGYVAGRLARFDGLRNGVLAWIVGVIVTIVAAIAGSIVGFYVAGQVPVLFAAAMLFLTPLSMLMSIARNSRMLIDRLALVLGLIVGPVLAASKVGLDLMWTGIIAGTIAYAVHRLREAMRRDH